MPKQKPTFRITIATDERKKDRISFQENDGPFESCLISDLPTPLLNLLSALDEGKRVEVLFAVVVDEKKIMLAEVIDK